MRKLLLLAGVCCALATPVFASPSTRVTVVTTNASFASQGGNGSGQVNVYLGAQGALATIKAPTNASTVEIHNFFGTVPVDPP